MKPLRHIINVVLALALAVQGVAAVASPVELAAAQDPAAAMDAVPCHGDAAEPAAPPAATPPCDCCDADCGGMIACTLAHLAAAPVSGFVVPAPSLTVADAPRVSALLSRPSPHFRPPIASA